MRKIVSFVIGVILTVMLCMMPSENAYANGSIKVSGVPSSVNIGDEFNVKVTCPKGISAKIEITYDASVIQFVEGDKASGGNGLVYVTGGSWGEDKEVTNTLKFKALKITDGATKISISTKDATDIEGNPITLGGTSASLTIINKAEIKSSDNSLSSITLSKGKLSPKFKYSVTKYTATVDYSVKSIVVEAKTSHAKAKIVSGVGSAVNLKVGENTIKIVVEAEDGKKATYTIVVTRKEKEVVQDSQTSESESTPPTESTTPPPVNEALKWNGEQLQVPAKIPTESIPKDFETTTLVVNGQQLQGLSFGKGELKVLYLNNTNGAGSLYVFDEKEQTLYPFIKIASEKSYVMVLLPDVENAPAPAGFESCTFSIEGKGTVNAYRLKDTTTKTEETTTSWNIFAPETFYAAPAKESEFYLIYCMNSNGEKGWYLYDSVEETFQRYLAVENSVPVGGDATGNTEDDTQLGGSNNASDELAKLEKELKTAKMTQYIAMGVAVVLTVIVIVLIVLLAMKKRNQEDDFFDGYEDEEDYDDEEDEDDEIEVEFYNMEERIVNQTVESEKMASVKEDAEDLEFIDFE